MENSLGYQSSLFANELTFTLRVFPISRWHQSIQAAKPPSVVWRQISACLRHQIFINLQLNRLLFISIHSNRFRVMEKSADIVLYLYVQQFEWVYCCRSLGNKLIIPRLNGEKVHIMFTLFMTLYLVFLQTSLLILHKRA